MKAPNQSTRAQRFRVIRDAVLRNHERFRPGKHGGQELAVGPFRITFYPPSALGPLRGYNLAIWPAGKIESGRMVYGDKVCNADWDQSDRVELLSFRSGPWETELLALLEPGDNVRPFIGAHST